MGNWFRWFFSADYRLEVEWQKNRYRWLVERQKLGLDEGTDIYIQHIKALTSQEPPES